MEEKSAAKREDLPCASESPSATSSRPCRAPAGDEQAAGPEFIFPTPQQQAAINELKEFNEEKVIAWATIIRSIEPGFRHDASGALSSQQLNALSILRECVDSNIIVWLQCPALAGSIHSRNGPRRPLSKASTASSNSRHVRRQSNKSAVRSSNGSFAPSTYSNTSYSTPRSSGYAVSLPDLPEGISGHTHWCYECDKLVNTCDGWKRHMKEHETYYPCMPLGPVEDTAEGSKCAFCGIQNPDHHHLAGHRTSLCSSNIKGAARKSRKALMIDHLALHGVFDTAALDLADKWQCTRNRRAFACGFCVKTFGTLTEQLNHIDNEHYKSGQGKSEWDISMVIKGLLHQPKVNKSWQKLLASDTPLLEDNFRWEFPTAETLQLRLETGNESGADLALTAFGSSIYDSKSWVHNMSPAITIPLLQHMATDTVPTTTHQHSGIPQYSPMNSFTGPVDAARQHSALVSKNHPDAPSWSEVNVPDSSFGSNDFGDRSSSLQAPFFDNDISRFQSQSHPYQYPSEPNFLNAGLGLDQHAQLQGHLNDDGNLVAPQLSFPEADQSASFADSDTLITPTPSGLTSSEHTNTTVSPSALFNVGGITTRGSGPDSREKPLPALPASHGKSTRQAVDHSPRSPMDVDFG